jgi:sulfur dioxygenase
LSRTKFTEVAPADVVRDPSRYHVIDVRQPDEFYGATGHVPGAVLVPLDQLAGSLAEWDRHRPLLVVCQSGRRSAMACAWLADEGFDAVHNLAGGMLAWRAAGGDACHHVHRVSSDCCIEVLR